MFKKLILLFVIAGLVYLGLNQTSFLKTQALPFMHLPSSQVLGLSTKRGGIQDQLTTSVNKNISSIEKQVGNIKMSQVISTLSSLKKVPSDISSIEKYINNQTKK